jgi:hypothetical protein
MRWSLLDQYEIALLAWPLQRIVQNKLSYPVWKPWALNSWKIIEHHWYSSLQYEGRYEPSAISAVVNATNKTTQTKGDKTFILHNLTRIKQISMKKKFKLLSAPISLSHEGQNSPFSGYCLPSWKILDNTKKWRATFNESCNCKFTIIQTTTILKRCISWWGDSQTWERQYP